jgi:biopolymer transport protein ExbB
MPRVLRPPAAAILSCACAAFLCAASLTSSALGQTPPTAVNGADDSVTARATAEPQGNARPSPTSFADAVPSALLPKDLSLWGMFLSADIIVKLVMIGLAFASFVTWTVALAKGLEVRWANRRLRRIAAVLSQASSLSEASAQLREQKPARVFVDAAMDEIRSSLDTADNVGTKERMALRLQRIEAGVGRAIARGTGVLATIGATAPFVGLFGTVWGIMNSFIGISKQHTTNLAVVAPGIAEALLATALGLVVAIPAVVIYNAFSRSIAAHRALCADAAAEVLRLASRDLDRNFNQATPKVEGARPVVLRQRP